MKKKYRTPAVTFIFILFIVLFPGLAPVSLLATAPGGNSFQLPEYEKFVLKNGLTVYLMEQHEVPLIYVSAVSPAGAVKDNGQYGLASLTAEGLLLGTRNYTKKQIEEKLDFLGASYSTSANVETARISLSFLNTHQETVFPILKEIMTLPVFDQTEFEKRKKRLLLELEQAKERPESVIMDYYKKFLFGDHGYGNPISGTPSSVKKIGVDDLKAFYKANYKPQEFAIALVGDFKTLEMKKRVKQLFNDWQVKGTSQKLKPRPLPGLEQPRLLLVNKEDATETQFIIGGLGIKRNNPDYVAVMVINTILGGRFTSWLNDELRVNAGLTYGAYSQFTPYKNPGIFVIGSFTKTATTIKAIDLALKVLNRLHRQGVDQKTLSSAKNYMKGQFPPRYETLQSLASLLTSMFFYNFDESFINNFQENVDKVTAAKAKEIISRYFPKNNLQFVLIGKSPEIRDKVKKYGKITEKELKTDGF
jgi:predicted Zn-dependent peptidase